MAHVFAEMRVLEENVPPQQRQNVQLVRTHYLKLNSSKHRARCVKVQLQHMLADGWRVMRENPRCSGSVWCNPTALETNSTTSPLAVYDVKTISRFLLKIQMLCCTGVPNIFFSMPLLSIRSESSREKVTSGHRAVASIVFHEKLSNRFSK